MNIDPRAIFVIEGFLKGLSAIDETSRVEAIFPFIHSILKNNEESWLRDEVNMYHFPRASKNCYIYQLPVKIAFVQPKGAGEITLRDRNEKGEFYDYYIMKKGQGYSLPSPVNIFFPYDGGEPKITYMGGL